MVGWWPINPVENGLKPEKENPGYYKGLDLSFQRIKETIHFTFKLLNC